MWIAVGFGFLLGLVALVMPSLLVLARTRAYPVVHITAAVAGVVLAAAWVAERTTLVDSDPLQGVSDVLVDHPFVVAALLAGPAVLSRLLPGLRTTSSAQTAAAPRTPDSRGAVRR